MKIRALALGLLVAAVALTAFSPAAGAQSIVVARGQTLWQLAGEYHTTVAALATANEIPDPNRILAGSHLQVPTGTLAAAAPASLVISAAAPAGGSVSSLPSLPLQLLAHPDRVQLRGLFVQWAAAEQVPASLLEALCWWESGWQPGVVSSAGAIGMGQLEPATTRFVRDNLLHDASLNPAVASDNIEMSAAFLHHLLAQTGGRADLALAAYYQGLASVQRQGLFASTRTYVTGILAYQAAYAW